MALVQAGLLGEDADARADLRIIATESVAGDLGGPRRRGDERAQETQGRGLAGAVRAQKAEYFALADLEIDRVHRDQIPETLGELLRAENGLHSSRVYF